MTPNPNPSSELLKDYAKRGLRIAAQDIKIERMSNALKQIANLPWASGRETPADACGEMQALAIAALTPPTPAETVTVALPGAGEVEWRDMGEAPPLTPVIAEFHEYNDPNGAIREQVVWFFEGEWRSFPSTKDLAYADRWRPMPTLATVAAANDEGVADDHGRVRQEAHVRGWKHGLEDAAKAADHYADEAETHADLTALGKKVGERWLTRARACRDLAAAIRLLSQGGGK